MTFIIKCGMYYLFLSKLQRCNLGNWYAISSNTLLNVWLLTHGLNHVSEKGPLESAINKFGVFQPCIHLNLTNIRTTLKPINRLSNSKAIERFYHPISWILDITRFVTTSHLLMNEVRRVLLLHYVLIHRPFQQPNSRHLTVVNDVQETASGVKKTLKCPPVLHFVWHMIQYMRGFFTHDDVIKWKHFPRYWPFVRGIHRSPVNSPHKGQWRGALMFSLICARINGWVNNGEAGE